MIATAYERSGDSYSRLHQESLCLDDGIYKLYRYKTLAGIYRVVSSNIKMSDGEAVHV